MEIELNPNGTLKYGTPELIDIIQEAFIECKGNYSKSAQLVLDRVPEIREYTFKDKLRKQISYMEQKGQVINPNMKVTTQKLDKKGNVTSTVLKHKKEEQNPHKQGTGHITSRTVNPYGSDWVKIDYNQLSEDDVSEAFEKIVKRHKVQGRSLKVKTKKTDKALIATRTDEHVGMAVCPSGLFTYEYNPKEYKKSISKFYNSIISNHNTHGDFDVVYLDQLGDAQDGFNGQTVRGGHTLEQNMTNGEVFELCLDQNIVLVESLLEQQICKKIVCRLVVNDNHAGDFGLTVALALKKFINRLYSKEIVEIDILENFIEHREYGDHCFLLTHGKDMKHKKFGLPYDLNDKAEIYIGKYIDHYGIDSKYVHLHKGDLHRIGYNASPIRFDYRNFGSFAPPSNWVTHNFGACRSSYAVQVVPKGNGEISHSDYFLDYKKIKE